jgi:PAS domain S-box-containing protein
LNHLIKRNIARKHFIITAADVNTVNLSINQRHLEEVVETMPVLMDAFDDEGKIIIWNRECEKVSGYSKAEIVGNPAAMKLFYPDTDYYNQVMETIKQGNHEQEFTLISKSGVPKTIRWCNASATFPIPGWASWGVGTDVTEQKRIQATLQESEKYYRLLFEKSPIAIWEKDYSAAWEYMDKIGIKELSQLDEYLKNDSGFLDKCTSLVQIGNISNATLSLFNVKSLAEFRSDWIKLFSRELTEDNIRRIFCFNEMDKSFENELIMQKLSGDKFHAIVHCSTLSFAPSKRPLKTVGP